MAAKKAVIGGGARSLLIEQICADEPGVLRDQ